MSTYDRVRTDVLVASAQRILTRARRNLPLRNRADALAIIRGLRLAPPRTAKVIWPAPVCVPKDVQGVCGHCQGPIYFGDVIQSSFNSTIDFHIRCKKEHYL